ncbi:MAG: hypothetical protein EXS05_23750 [Planctomycetaceae bacterium]|nr:hypothetical protein [Planctomycetaceae bacterium]
MNPRTLLLLGLGLLICCVACCGGLAMFGLNTQTEEVRQKLESDRQFSEHVGQINAFQIELIASFSIDDEDVYIYSVEGTKWSGRITVKHVTGDDDLEHIVWVRFTLPSGEQIELHPEQPLEDPAPMPPIQLTPPAGFIKRAR